MKRVFLLSIILVYIGVLIGCGQNTDRTIEAAIQNQILLRPDLEMQEVLYQEEIENGVLVIYSTNERWTGISYLSKTNGGWKHEAQELVDVMIHLEGGLGNDEVTWSWRAFPRTAESDEDDYVALYYGVIKSSDIVDVMVSSTLDDQLKYKAQILIPQRIWVVVIPPDAVSTMSNHVEIVGLSADGDVLYSYP